MGEELGHTTNADLEKMFNEIQAGLGIGEDGEQQPNPVVLIPIDRFGDVSIQFYTVDDAGKLFGKVLIPDREAAGKELVSLADMVTGDGSNAELQIVLELTSNGIAYEFIAVTPSDNTNS